MVKSSYHCLPSLQHADMMIQSVCILERDCRTEVADKMFHGVVLSFLSVEIKIRYYTKFNVLHIVIINKKRVNKMRTSTKRIIAMLVSYTDSQ